MFSSTTTELSTSMPMASDRPPSDMMFTDTPVKYMSSSASSTENGMETATSTVGFQSRRNSASTTTASRPPRSSEFTMEEMNMSMSLPWSDTTRRSRLGNSSDSSATASRQAADTWLVEAVEDLYTDSSTPSPPFRDM